MNAKISSRTVYLMIGFAVLSLFAGFLGTLVTITGPDSWFALELIKPAWQPPNYLFAPVWTTLYILMVSPPVWSLQKDGEKKKLRSLQSYF